MPGEGQMDQQRRPSEPLVIPINESEWTMPHNVNHAESSDSFVKFKIVDICFIKIDTCFSFASNTDYTMHSLGSGIYRRRRRRK